MKITTTLKPKKDKKLKRLLATLVVLVLPLQINGQSINARFSTSFYSWERHPAESLSENHFRLYQTAQITMGQLASNRLSFHLYGQASQDIAESADADPIPRLYNAYFLWKERKGVVDKVKLGRQRVYSGVAYGTIDGLDLNLRIGKRFRVGGFIGVLVPFSNNIEIDDWNDGHAFGLRLSTNNLLGTRILVSFMQRNRRPVAYSAPGQFTQKKLTFESLEQRLVGLDAYRKLSRKLSAYGRLDYDIEQERVRRGQFELRFAPTNKLQVTGEFFHRAPLISANSIFSVFTQKTTQDVGLRVNYGFKKNWSFSGRFGIQLFEGDETVRFGLGLRSKYGYLGYSFRRGYGGQTNGLVASLNYPLTQKLGFMASTGFSRYGLFDENTNKSTSLAGSFGFNYRPHKNLSVDLLGQGVRNRFYSNDFRFFAKATYWLFGK